MNPITQNRYALVRYVVLWGLLAVAWAAAFDATAGLTAELAALDGAVFGVTAGFEGTILWNVLKYGTEGVTTPLLRTVYRVTVGTLFVAVAVGATCLAMWAATATTTADTAPTAATAPTAMFASFAKTIPARCLTAAAVYVCFALWFWSATRSEGEAGGHGAEIGGRTEPAEPAERAKTTETAKSAGPATPTNGTLERITVRSTSGRVEVIPLEHIICLQAEGDYVAIITNNGRWLKEGTMKWFENTLPQQQFVRVHRSYIVAINHISRIETSGRDHTLTLRHNHNTHTQLNNTIRISDSGYRLLKQTLGL